MILQSQIDEWRSKAATLTLTTEDIHAMLEALDEARAWNDDTTQLWMTQSRLLNDIARACGVNPNHGIADLPARVQALRDQADHDRRALIVAELADPSGRLYRDIASEYYAFIQQLMAEKSRVKVIACHDDGDREVW